ncbi:MAG: sulfotransferase [Bdellovibrionales bacterium]|nr:sulfotransferase [Bdellovibrionales bacterium]
MKFAPSFIGGCGRSGTTLLVDLLGLHPQLSPIYETDFVVNMPLICFDPEIEMSELVRFADRWSIDLPYRPHSKRDYEKYYHGPHHVLFTREEMLLETAKLIDQLQQGVVVECCFAQLIENLFTAHCNYDSKPYWINKTPIYVLHLEFLMRLFPDMRFVHVVRNGLNVAKSIVTRPWGPDTLEQALAYHEEHVASGRAWGKSNPQQYREVEYEKLVTLPEQEIAGVLEWLGLDPKLFPFERIEIRRSPTSENDRLT